MQLVLKKGDYFSLLNYQTTYSFKFLAFKTLKSILNMKILKHLLDHNLQLNCEWSVSF